MAAKKVKTASKSTAKKTTAAKPAAKATTTARGKTSGPGMRASTRGR